MTSNDQAALHPAPPADHQVRQRASPHARHAQARARGGARASTGGLPAPRQPSEGPREIREG